jgi:hypothetical protein
MNISLRTSCDIHVELQPSRFHCLQAGSAEHIKSDLLVPVIPAQAGVVQMASRIGSVTARCAMLSLPDSRFGIVMVGSGRDLTALLFDLG